MEALLSFVYVAGGTALILLLCYLVGRKRSHKTRSHGEEEEASALRDAQRRYEAGQMTARDLEEVRRRHAGH